MACQFSCQVSQIFEKIGLTDLFNDYIIFKRDKVFISLPKPRKAAENLTAEKFVSENKCGLDIRMCEKLKNTGRLQIILGLGLTLAHNFKVRFCMEVTS